jgi:hypothetical protein
MASPQSVLPCPWLAFRDTPCRLPATRTKRAPRCLPDHSGVATRSEPRQRSSERCERVARPVVVRPLAMLPPRASGQVSWSHGHQWVERNVHRRVPCRCSRLVSGGHLGPAVHRRSGEQSDPQVLPRPSRPPPKRRAARPAGGAPAKPSTAEAASSETRRRARIPSSPSAEAAGKQGSRAIRSTRVLAASSGRKSGPPRPLGCRRSPPRAAAGRSQLRCGASLSDASRAAEATRDSLDDALHHRPRAPSAIAQTLVKRETRHWDRRIRATPSLHCTTGAGPVHRRVGRSLTTVTRTVPRRLRAQRAHRSTWSSSLKARLRLGRPSARSHADCHQGLGVLPPPCPATLSRHLDPQAGSRRPGAPRGPHDVRFTGGPPMGFGTLRRLRKRAATCAGLTTPGCAAPSGFLSLLTPCSARNLSGLVSCR